MKHNDHIQTTESKPGNHRSDNGQQGRLLAALSVALGAFAVIGIAIYAVVRTSQRLEPPKDTEIGIIAVVAAVTLLAILGQIAVTVLQWKAMRDALEHSEQSMMFDQAAYVIVSTGRVLSSGGDQKAKAVYEMINAGRTPAYKVRTYSNIGWRKLDFKFTKEDLNMHLVEC